MTRTFRESLYDPFEHAARLGIEVVRRRLDDENENGLWVPDLHAIFLRPGMRSIHERSVLSHELGHACLGHRETTPRNELRANRWAARKLIIPELLTRAAAHSPDPGTWCHELNVSADILDRYLKDHHAA